MSDLKRKLELQKRIRVIGFDDADQRRKDLQQAGTIYQQKGFVFQVVGCDAEIAAKVLLQLTDTGLVPESLRLAHLIGAAVKKGESSNRA